MTDEKVQPVPQDVPAGEASSPGSEEPVTAGEPVTRVAARARAKKRKHWSWKRWLANVMIICGVLLLPGYFLSTCACTALHQRDLRQQLEASNPQLAAAAAALDDTGFVAAETTTTQTTIDPVTAAEEAARAAQQAAIAAMEAERQAQLAAFKAAADAFAQEVSGHLRTPLGRIVIPRIDVDVVMLEGTSKRDLKEGPGHWEETPFPGQGGNFVVSGHRTTYGAPFLHLDDLEIGDEIQLILPYAVARYAVTEVLIVYPDEVETVDSVGKEQVSLAACHPIYSAKQRIVAKGDLISFKLVESEG